MIENLLRDFLTLSVPEQATVLLLALVALHQFNKGHIGRIGIASAGVLIFTKAYPVWSQLAGVWQAYTIVASAFAVIAGSSYTTKTSLPSEFYRVALLLLGGVPVLLAWQFGFPL